ncbi:MAG TPA: hypothetical protein VFM15_02575 [Gammaproteobacteria bacterium]|nr:hypothetical protein [Gammaproteobacteria bacterium]
MNKERTFWLAAISILILIVVVTAYFAGGRQERSVIETASSQQSKTTPSTSRGTASITTHPNGVYETKNSVQPLLKKTIDASTFLNANHQWRLSRGYETPNDPYENYSQLTLLDLAQQGDALAQSMLAKQFGVAGDSKHASYWGVKALVHGATAPINILAGYGGNDSAYSQDKVTAARESGLTWGLVGAMRGDPGGVELVTSILKNANGGLSKNEITVACNVAKHRYQAILDARRKAGLPAFSDEANRFPHYVVGVKPDSMPRICPNLNIQLPKCISVSLDSPSLRSVYPDGFPMKTYECSYN